LGACGGVVQAVVFGVGGHLVEGGAAAGSGAFGVVEDVAEQDAAMSSGKSNLDLPIPEPGAEPPVRDPLRLGIRFGWARGIRMRNSF